MIKEEIDQEVRELLQRPRDCFINSAHPAMEDPEHWCVEALLASPTRAYRKKTYRLRTPS
jgi:hypothetical protein